MLEWAQKQTLNANYHHRCQIFWKVSFLWPEDWVPQAYQISSCILKGCLAFYFFWITWHGMNYMRKCVHFVLIIKLFSINNFTTLFSKNWKNWKGYTTIRMIAERKTFTNFKQLKWTHLSSLNLNCQLPNSYTFLIMVKIHALFW